MIEGLISALSWSSEDDENHRLDFFPRGEEERKKQSESHSDANEPVCEDLAPKSFDASSSGHTERSGLDLVLIDVSNELEEEEDLLREEEEMIPPRIVDLDQPESMDELVESMRQSAAGISQFAVVDGTLKRRIQDFYDARKQRFQDYTFRPFGIIGLFINLSDIRSDLQWAQDAAIRRAEGKAYVSWKDFERSRRAGHNFAYFTYTFLCVSVFMMMFAFHRNGWKIEPLDVNPLVGPTPETLLSLGALRMAEMKEDGSWYRLITAIFLHGGLLHLFINLLVIYIMGRTIERNHGPWITAMLFFLSGVGGNIISALMQPNFVLVGASGGIFGLIGLCVADVALNWKLLFLVFKNDDGTPGGIWTKVCCISWLFCDLVLNSLIGFTPYVDNFSHLGGMTYGFLVSLTVLQRLPLSFFGSGSTVGHRLKIAILRFLGVILAVAGLCSTALLLAHGDGVQSPCYKCRYISCAPFPFWTEDKWWYCDGCDAVQGTIYKSATGEGFVELDLTCPSASDIATIDVSKDGLTEDSNFPKLLSDYCRQNCF